MIKFDVKPKPPKQYIIIDFSAGNQITHHLDYVITHAKFLKSAGHKVVLVLPKYTPKDLKVLNEFDIRRALTSDIYNTLSFQPLSFIYNFYLKYLQNFNAKISYCFRLYMVNNHLKKAEKVLVHLLNEDSESIILFPSVDSLAIYFTSLVVRKNYKLENILLRFTDIQFKNKLSASDELKVLRELLKSNKGQIVLGCETKPLISEFKKLEIGYKDLYLAPLPHISRSLQKNDKEMIFGFLGGAKRRKGFGEIPDWIKEIKKISKNAKFVVQQTPYPWNGYENVLNTLKSIENVTILPQIIEKVDFFKIIEDCSYIVLPYESESYKLTGSSILFYASDMLIPTIANSGCGFSRDLSFFKCGIVIDDFRVDIAKIVFNERERRQLIEGIYDFNEERNKNSNLFLKL